MKATDVEWARVAVREMLMRLMGVCATQLQADGLASLHAAMTCRKWRT
jgi:hypothetical protein